MTRRNSDSPLMLEVGLLAADRINVLLHGNFRASSGETVSGEMTFGPDDAGVEYLPVNEDASFTVQAMRIGIGFHWDSLHDLTFRGGFRIAAADGGAIRIINMVDMEEYLRSVISSEMSQNSSGALLRAHAVISRSWVLAQILHRGSKRQAASFVDTPGEIIRWWDREDHDGFDVCADDHCQRYQGITEAVNPEVERAVVETRGLVLADMEGNLVDARFSKCCGGATELFSSCWSSEERHPSLQGFSDSPHPGDLPDLSSEESARAWIMGRPEAFCADVPRRELSQVLKDYDLTTRDFYRWQVKWDAIELTENIHTRLPGERLGRVVALVPVERGTSGRIVRLLIKGTEGEVTVGKELLIRKVLSTSHLYSSAFVVETGPVDEDGYPESFTLHGAGWGHGVGLCQIGAAAMGEMGYGWREILSHYFPGSSLVDASSLKGSSSLRKEGGL